MFSLNSAKRSLTLLFALALLIAVSSPVSANDHTLHHREHQNLKRLIKKRTPLPQGLFGGGLLGGNGAVAGASDDPPDTGAAAGSSSSSVASSSSSIAASQSSSSSASSVSTSSAASSSSTSVSASASSSSSGSTSASESTSSSASTSESSTAASASSTEAAASTTAQASAETGQAQNTEAAAGTSQTASGTHASQAFVTKTTTVDATDSPVVEPQSASAKNKGTALTVLIAVAASVGGVAIIWTIFRKWKLGRSSKFDERLQPIDWQPKGEDDINGGVPGLHRSPSHASSFHSAGHSNYNGNNNFSDHGHGAAPALQPIPDHDFTAGTNSLAPVGGYADLARGPSPQPQMQEPLGRGLSFNRGYDAGVPLHHQTGYGAHDAYDYNGGAAAPRY